MKLQQVKHTPNEVDIIIHCVKCGIPYAISSGHVYADLDGEPYKAYYCHNCVTDLKLAHLDNLENEILKYGRPEAHKKLNQIQRAKIRVMSSRHASGKYQRCFLYNINYDYIAKEYHKGMVYNFDANLVMSYYSSELCELIKQFRESPSMALADRIFDFQGAVSLTWS